MIDFENVEGNPQHCSLSLCLILNVRIALRDGLSAIRTFNMLDFFMSSFTAKANVKYFFLSICFYWTSDAETCLCTRESEQNDNDSTNERQGQSPDQPLLLKLPPYQQLLNNPCVMVSLNIKMLISAALCICLVFKYIIS